MRAAVDQDMAILAYDWFPDGLNTPKKAENTAPQKRGLFGKVFEAPDPFEGVGGYSFLHRTSNWTAEEICLAYTLTEPAVSSAWVETADMAHFDRLTEVPDRDLPPGLGAQIEMARFSAKEQKSA